MNPVIIDVRERDEYAAEHIEHSINVPLSHFAVIAPGVLNQLQESEVLIMCRSGARAKLAEKEIAHLGFSDKIKAAVFEGGILEWRKQGKPTLSKNKTHFPIMRQVQFIAGSTILICTILGATVNPRFLLISGFFGAGLTVAGATGFCGMARVLELMPWNKSES